MSMMDRIYLFWLLPVAQYEFGFTPIKQRCR